VNRAMGNTKQRAVKKEDERQAVKALWEQSESKLGDKKGDLSSIQTAGVKVAPPLYLLPTPVTPGVVNLSSKEAKVEDNKAGKEKDKPKANKPTPIKTQSSESPALFPLMPSPLFFHANLMSPLPVFANTFQMAFAPQSGMSPSSPSFLQFPLTSQPMSATYMPRPLLVGRPPATPVFAFPSFPMAATSNHACKKRDILPKQPLPSPSHNQNQPCMPTSPRLAVKRRGRRPSAPAPATSEPKRRRIAIKKALAPAESPKDYSASALEDAMILASAASSHMTDSRADSNSPQKPSPQENEISDPADQPSTAAPSLTSTT
jgi:hypothetical protein